MVLLMSGPNVKEGQAPVPENTCYTDDSCWGQPPPGEQQLINLAQITRGWKMVQEKVVNGMS